MNERLYAPLFRRYAEGIVYKVSQMQIREWHDGPNATLFVKVSGDDIGLLCGAQGKIIRAFQLIFQRIGRQDGKHVRISVDRLGNKVEDAQKFRITEAWDRTQEALDLLSDTFTAMGFDGDHLEVEEQHDTTLITLKEPKLDEPLFDAV